jgi:DNA mismatch repair protein MutS
MQQYREVKERFPSTLVLFRVGDFFELFNNDAETASKTLGLTLTSRDNKSVPMAGFPHHALDAHVLKLVQAGFSVAVCDQVEDPASAQGLVRREVVRVVTPGTVTEEELLDPRRANHLVAVWPEGDRVGLAWAELSTGAFHAADVAWARLADELGRLAPAEILHPEEAPARLTELLRSNLPGTALTARPDWTFDPASARAALFHHYQVRTSAGFGFDDRQPCLSAAGALLLYLKETCKANLAHLRRPRPFRPEGHLILDEVTRRSLELTRTLREGSREGSLLAHLDRTVTPMGARLLQESLLAPLTDRPAIEARLDAVAEFVASTELRRELRDRLAQAADLHRLSARAGTGRCRATWPPCSGHSASCRPSGLSWRAAGASYSVNWSATSTPAPNWPRSWKAPWRRMRRPTPARAE